MESMGNRKAMLGDTVRIPVPSKLEALDEEGINRQIRESLVAMAQGTVPEWACEKYKDVVLTTQAMVDEYNDQ